MAVVGDRTTAEIVRIVGAKRRKLYHQNLAPTNFVPYLKFGRNTVTDHNNYGSIKAGLPSIYPADIQNNNNINNIRNNSKQNNFINVHNNHQNNNNDGTNNNGNLNQNQNRNGTVVEFMTTVSCNL